MGEMRYYKEELTVDMVPEETWKGKMRGGIHFVEMLGMRE